MVANNNETDRLRQEVNQLKSMLDTLLAEKKQNESVVDDQYDNFDSIKILQEEYIKVMSLCPMELNLSTEGMGKGKRFKFDKFGDIKRILYSDLVDIMESNSHFLNYGFFYILDKRVIRKHGLDDAYEKLLTKEKIEKVISFNEKDAVDLFNSANKNQKDIMIDMIIEKIKNSENVDLNIIDKISRIAGVNLYEKGQEAKEFSELIPA